MNSLAQWFCASSQCGDWLLRFRKMSFHWVTLLHIQLWLRPYVTESLWLQPDPWLSATCTRGATHGWQVGTTLWWASVLPAMCIYTPSCHRLVQRFSAAVFCLQSMLNVYCKFRVYRELNLDVVLLPCYPIRISGCATMRKNLSTREFCQCMRL